MPRLFIFVVSNAVRKDCLLATQVPHSGVVHNKEVGCDQGKFLITEVLDVWEGYGSDVYCPGSYIWCGFRVQWKWRKERKR